MYNCHKRLWLVTMLLLEIIVLLFIAFYRRKPDIEISIINNEWFYEQSNDEQLYRAWETDGIIHFLTPGYFEDASIRFANGDINKKGKKTYDMKYDKPEHIVLYGYDGSVYEKDICIHRGNGIYTVNLKLFDGNEAAAINKEDFLDAQIRLTAPDGNDKLSYIPVRVKGRGNSTWFTDKQPYVLEFDDDVSILGMNAQNKYLLLAGHYEGSKILSKMMFDLNKDIGMSYTIDSAFVNLYINGDYRGIYTICEPVDHGIEDLGQKLQRINEAYSSYERLDTEESDVNAYYSEGDPKNITGVYIIEKDIQDYYREDPLGFRIDKYYFAMKYPNNLTIGEAEYVRDRFEVINTLLEKRDQKVFEYIDVDSFATRYISEEFAGNSDGARTSWYYYYKSNDPHLYAGPGWDYDGSFGESNGFYQDYNRSILDVWESPDMDEVLRWDERLLEIPEYKEFLSEKYRQIRPLLVELYSRKVNTYFNEVYKSVNMDNIRWNHSDSRFEAGHYYSYDNEKRYIRFFMYHRIRFLDEMLSGQKEELAEPERTDAVHILTFHYDDGTDHTLEVKDGDLLREDMLPDFDKDNYVCWIYEYGGRPVNEYQPVYEDTDLYLQPVSE